MDFSVPVGFLRRSDFSPDFLFGSSTSAFQIEGGCSKDGRQPSIFDTMAKRDGLFEPYGEDAVNHRQLYKEDVKLMKDIGFNAYRFSISWCRVMPNGKRSEEGINFYKDLLRNLKDAGIVPLATLVHFDPPQYLEDEYYTFLSPRIVDDFCKYAELCFQEFGEYVKYWTTINEPWFVCDGGYRMGVIPPGYKSDKDHDAMKEAALLYRKENSGSKDHSSLCPPLRPCYTASSAAWKPVRGDLPPPEQMPFLAAHYQILAHAKAAQLYKSKYQKKQGGKIGLNMVAQWFVPLEDTKEHKDAAKRALDFMLGWFMDPLYKGDYPDVMRQYVTGNLLPYFTREEKKMVKGSYDFISLNYYTAQYASNFPYCAKGDYVLDRQVDFQQTKNEIPIGQVAAHSKWLIGYPKGLLELLLHIKDNYGNPEICITENGLDDKDDDSMTHWESFHDQKRVLYIHDHFAYIKEAIRKGVNVTGHFVWSLLDNCELAVGFKSRFGITYVDYDEDAKRIPKYSATWYKHFLRGGDETSEPVDLRPLFSQMETLEAKVGKQESQIEDLQKLIGALTTKPEFKPPAGGASSVDLEPILKMIDTMKSKLLSQESQINYLNNQIRELTTKLDAMPSNFGEIDLNSSSNRVNIGKILVLSCQVPVVQEAIGKALLRWASADGARLWDLAHWESLLDSSKHRYYGGGFNIKAAVVGHPTKHGVNITIPTWVDDREFSKIRNSQQNNEVEFK